MHAMLSLFKDQHGEAMAVREVEGKDDIKQFLAEAVDRITTGQEEGEVREVFIGIKVVG